MDKPTQKVSPSYLRRVRAKLYSFYKRRTKLAVSLLSVFALVVIGAGSLTYIQSARAETSANIVILNYDGEQRTIPTTTPTVGKLLSKLNIELDKGDVVEPALTTKIDQNRFRINVYPARPVEIVDGKHKIYSFSAATRPRTVARQADVKVYPEDTMTLGPVTNFTKDNTVGDKIVIHRATPVKLMLYGHKSNIRTQGKTVGELLKDRKIKLKKGDTLTPSADTPITSDMMVAINHKGTKYVTETEAIPMPVKYVTDKSLSVGTSAIRQHGSNGKREATYKIIMKHKREVSRKLVQKVIITEPVEQVVARGTANNGYSGSLSSWLQALRQCESGGNYQTNTGNGYYGAYQFSEPTWNSLHTGYDRADLAPPDVQDRAIIANTNRSSGLTTQNPGCYYKTGISNKPPSK